MHSSFLRPAALLLALGALACRREAPGPTPAAPGFGDNTLNAQSGAGDLLPDYTDRGIVILNANPQRPNYWDFDLVAYGDRPTHVFRLKNLDAKPITLRNMLPSCGCVLPTLKSADGKQVVRGLLTEDAPPFRIEPGGEFELEISIDTTVVERMNLDKLVFVRLVSDSENTPFFSVEAHLKVTRDFLCTPALIDLGEVPQTYGKRASGTVITASPESKASIRRVTDVVGPFVATVDETEVAGQRNWMVVVDAKEDVPLGFARGKVVLETTGSDGTGTGRPFEIPVTANVVPRIVARPAQARLLLTQDQVTITLECLVPGEKVALRKVRFEGPGPDFACETAALQPDEGRSTKWTITLHVTREGAGGGYTRTAVLELDDPKIPELRVPVTVEKR